MGHFVTTRFVLYEEVVHSSAVKITSGKIISSKWFISSTVLKPWASILAEFSGVWYADHVRFDPCHSYIERLPTL